MPKQKFTNPVVEMYRGKKIYLYNKVFLRITPESMKKIIDLTEDTGLSIAQVLGHSSKPCDCCRNVQVITFNSNNEKVNVDRGILFKSTQARYGNYELKNKTNEQSNGTCEADNERA